MRRRIKNKLFSNGLQTCCLTVAAFVIFPLPLEQVHFHFLSPEHAETVYDSLHSGPAPIFSNVIRFKADTRLSFGGTDVKETATIRAAAERNGCLGDNYLILLAIRKAENGLPGKEFGVLHPKAAALIKEAPARSLDIQAGWCASTIVKNRIRWIGAGCPASFIDFLGDRYCPAEVDPEGNKNWKYNVKFWFERFKNETI